MDVGCSAIAVPELPPVAFWLHQNHPNPFNPKTTIHFDLDAAAFVDLAVYACGGRRIATLVRESRAAGQHQETWTGRDGSGRRMPSGVYLCRLEIAGQVETRRMILLK